MRRIAPLALAFLLFGILAACGDDDGDTSAPADDTSAEEGDTAADDGDGSDGDAPADSEDDDSAPEAGSGDAGTVTVDGTTYEMNEALLCDPDSADTEMMDRELELQVLGERGNQLDVYISSIADMPLYDVSWSGPEGLYSNSVSQMGGAFTGETGDTYEDAPVSVDGNRATGTITVHDLATLEDTLEITFDVVVPDETFECR